MKLSQFLKMNKVSYSEVSPNVVFQKLTEGLHHYEKNPEFDYVVEIRSFGLELNGVFHFNIHNGIAISVGEIGLIFINSYGDSGLEISHLWVSPIQQRMGLGTRLVREVFNLCHSIIGNIPLISLECTGNISHNGKWYTTGISGQTAFYRKFGFRVSDRKKYPYYVRMERIVNLTCNESSQRNVNVFEQRTIDNLQSAA